ncbi:tail virion protein G7P-2 [Xenorhabdus sp. BG5]|nr:tail virion protein G7P-2 [Xenorhabdus sp. BG5]
MNLSDIYDLIFNIGLMMCFSLGVIAGGQR